MACGTSGSKYDLSGNQITQTYGRLVQAIPASTQSNIPKTGSSTLYDGYGNKIIGLSLEELQVTGSGIVTGDLVVGGTITAQEFRGELISSSIIYESGSTKFGDTADDTHQFTGSVFISGITISNEFVGDLTGTSTTSSYVEYENVANKPTLFSGSSQVNADNITNFDTNVKTKLDTENVISGSSQVVLDNADKTNFDTDDVSEGTNLYYTDSRVKEKLNTENVISGSSQVILDNADKTNFDTDDVSEGSNLYYTDDRVKTKLDTENVISSSAQVTITESQISDLRGYALTGSSNIFEADQTIQGNLIVTDTITAQEFHTEFVSSSIIYESGSTKFGDTADDTHQFTGSVSISGSITNVDSIQFDTTVDNVPNTGQLEWNVTDGTLDLGVEGGNAVLQLGQEVYFPYVVNSDTADIVEGTLVMVDQSSPVQGQRVKVVRAVTDGTVNPDYVMGIATEDILQNEQGFITYFGAVRGISISELESVGQKDPAETWTSGDFIWPDPDRDGGLTHIQPASGNLRTRVGTLTSVNGNNANLSVRMNLGSRIQDLYDVDYNVKHQGALITFDSGSGVWKTQNSLSGSYDITGSLSVSGSISGQIENSFYRMKRVFVTGSYNVSPTDYLIGVNTVSGSVTLTFPSSSNDTYEFIIKDEGYNIENEPITFVSVDPNDRFENNETSLILNENGTSVTIYSNGTGNYYII